MVTSVIGQQVNTVTNVVFWVQQDSNSPYQGFLSYDAAAYAATTPQQVQADELAQYNSWLAAQKLSADQLTTQEVAANLDQVMTLGSLASISLANSTAAQNVSAVRVAYQSATQFQAIMIGDFFNTMTDSQLRVIFSLTLAQAQALRANKLAPAASIASSIRAAAGQ